MKLKYYFVGLCFCLNLFGLSVAYSATPTEAVSQFFASVHTMQANFVQTTFDNRNKPIQKSQGSLAFQRPGMFRWEIKRPIPQLIVGNGRRAWIYDPDLDQVVIRSLTKSAGETPALLLSQGNPAISREFIVRAIKNSSSLSWFALTPRKRDSMFERIDLGFSRGALQAMRLIDHLGHSTLIEFRNATFNLALSSSLFTFSPPANADVIDETRR